METNTIITKQRDFIHSISTKNQQQKNMNDPKESSKVNRLKQDLLSQTENELQLRGLRVLKNEIYTPWQSTTTTEIKKAALKLVKELTDQHLAPASVLATTIKQQSFETMDSIEQEKALMNRVRNGLAHHHQNLLAAAAAAEEEEEQRELQLNCATTARANNKTSSTIIIETMMSDFRSKLGMSINEYQVNVFDASLKAHADEKLRQKNAAKVFGYNIVSDDSDNGGHHDDDGGEEEEEDEDEDDNEDDDDDDNDNNEGILEANLQQSRQMATEAYERSKKILNEVCQELDSDKITPLKRKLDAINQFHNLMIRVLASNFSAVNDLKGSLNEMMIMNQPHSHNKHLHHQYPSPSSLSTSPSSSRPSSIITTACHRFHHEIDNMQTRLEILGNKEMNQIGMEAQAFQHTQSLQKATIQAGCTDPSLNNKINLSHAKSDLILRRSVHTKADLLLTQTANKFDELLKKSRSVLQNNDNLISRAENDMSQLRTQDNLEERLTAEEAVKEIRTQVHATLEREINTRFQGAARIQSHTTKQQVSRLGTAGQLQEDLLFKEMSKEFEKKLLTSSPQSAAYPHHQRHPQQQEQQQQQQQHTQQMDIENEGEEEQIRRREERERERERRRIERERESITAAGKKGRADGEGKDINQSSTNPTTTKPPKFINPKPLVVGGGNVKPCTTKNLSTIAELIARSKPSGPVVKEPSVKKK